MKVYRLTQFGFRIARSVRSPDTASWKVIHLLDRLGGQATDDQIADGTGLSVGEVGRIAGRLRMKHIVEVI
jgi:hypothetical protein